MRHLNRICVTNHVVREHDIALAREADDECGPRVAGLVCKPARLPGSMMVQNPRMPGLFVARPVEIATEIKSGQRFDEHFLDGVSAAFDLSEDMRMERRLLRHRRQSCRNQNLVTDRK